MRRFKIAIALFRALHVASDSSKWSTGDLGGNALEDVVDEAVQGSHCLVRDHQWCISSLKWKTYSYWRPQEAMCSRMSSTKLIKIAVALFGILSVASVH
jgi:hypothetical protein